VSALVDPGGRFHARLRAVDFAGIEVAVADGTRRSPWIEFGEVQPQLENTGEDLIVRCLPDQQFLLLAVPAREPGKDAANPGEASAACTSARIFGSWRGRAGSSGLARYSLSFLGAHRTGKAQKAKRASLALVLVTEVLGEKRTSARLPIR
jgi:hypothetical protein